MGHILHYKSQLLFQVAILCILIFSLSGCSDGPSTDNLKEGILDSLPSYADVVSVEIKGQDNEGTEAEPRYITRFVTEVEYEEDLYEKVSQVRGGVKADVVRILLMQGDVVKYYGKSLSILHHEKWKSIPVKMDSEEKVRGYPLSKFDNPVVEGSAEHKIVMNQHDAWKKEALAQREEEKRMKREAKVKARAEQKAKAEKEIAVRRAKFRPFSGKWVSTKEKMEITISEEGKARITYVGKCSGPLRLFNREGKTFRVSGDGSCEGGAGKREITLIGEKTMVFKRFFASRDPVFQATFKRQ